MLIVNSCIGGFWIEEARRLCLGGENGLTIIAGGRSDEMSYAHSISGSGKARGGYFVNALTAALYRQYGLFFFRGQRSSSLGPGMFTRPYSPRKSSSLCGAKIRPGQSGTPWKPWFRKWSNKWSFSVQCHHKPSTGLLHRWNVVHGSFWGATRERAAPAPNTCRALFSWL
jgi:hypothetical protein